MTKKTIRDLDIQGKRVLIRVDFNVPQNEQGKITDDSRIVKSLPTLRYAIEKGGRVILMSHLGRPGGQRKPQFSLQPVAQHLSDMLHRPVELLDDCIGTKVEERIERLREGEVVLLENLRFHPQEEKNDTEFAKALARLADVYINDAFGAAHRAHASTEAIAHHLPSAAGILLARELEYLQKALASPEHPFVIILGGAKVSDKIKIVANLLRKADALLIGGAMAYPFCRVKGFSIGGSKFESGGELLARQILEQAQHKGVQVVLPSDHVMTQKLGKGVPARVVDRDIPAGWMGLDIGPKTVEEFQKVLAKAKTILWNGPLGVFEIPPFETGTRKIAEYIASLTAATIIGGGDTAAAIRQLGLEDKMSHVSTGGGASLEYLEGKVLPGVAALPERENSLNIEAHAR